MKRSVPLVMGPLALAAVILSVLFFVRSPGRPVDRLAHEEFLLEQYQKLPRYTEEELREIPKPEHPDLAAFQDFFMTLDPELGRVPTERLKTAFMEKKNMQVGGRSKAYGALVEWKGTVANMGGRTRALLMDPNDPAGNAVWAGGVTGGLWYNENIRDEDSPWIPVNDFWDNLAVSSIAADPGDPRILYVGTGEAFTAVTIYRESSGRGMGIWKSTDAGFSWGPLPSTEYFAYVTDIALRLEEGASVIYAGVVSGVYHGIHESYPSDGLYRSTDGGQIWTQVLPEIAGLSSPYAPADIEIGPDGRIYVGTMKNIRGQGGATILRSDAGTAGTWAVFDDYVSIIEADPTYPVPGRVMMASAPSDEEIVYAVIGSGYINQYGFNLSYGNYFIRSTDRGETWSPGNIPPDNQWGNWATLAWHALTIEVDPNDPDVVWIGGLDLNRSTDGGNSWQHLSDWAAMYEGGGDQYVHADQHAIVFPSGSSDEVLFANDGGIFSTANGTSATPLFIERNKGYNTLQYYTCDIHPEAGANYYLGGLQDNGTLLYADEPLDISHMVSGGDGAYCFYDDDEPDLFITSTYYNRYYVFIGGDRKHSLSQYYSGMFVNPADYDHRLNILYANATTFDGQYQNMMLRIGGLPDNPEGDFLFLNTETAVPFSHVRVSPHAPEGTTTLFLGTQAGRVYKVFNAQSLPVAVEIGSPAFPAGNVSCIAIGPSEDTLLVAFSNYGVSSVWQTHDGGQSWREAEGNLPDMPVRWAIYHPQQAHRAMLATEIGIWTTEDLSEGDVSWKPDIEGLANVRVDMLSLREADNTVLAATHGRGLFTANYPAAGVRGDVNGDGQVDIHDVVRTLHIIIQLGDPPGEQELRAADMNGDGRINILDVVLIVNVILGIG